MDELTPLERASLSAIQGSQERLTSVLVRVVKSVRGKIVAGDAPLGPDGTVPEQLMNEVIDVARWRWLISFPQLVKMQTRERKDANDKALEELGRVQSGDVKIEDPNSQAADPQAWTILPKVRHRPRSTGPGREDGV